MKYFGYFIMFIGVLSFAFFRKYNGQNEVLSWGSLIVGLILFVIGVLLAADIFKARREHNQALAELHNFKQNGERIEVDLANCEVKTNSYTETTERFSDDDTLNTAATAYQAITFAPLISSTSEENIHQTVLLYRKEHNGHTITFKSEVIPFDEDNMRMKLALQKSTTIYLHPDKPGQYYFDTEFLYT